MGPAKEILKKKVSYSLVLITIVLIAAFFRFLFLGKIPFSLNWDEVAIGYNSFSILKTGKDEFGVKFPLFLRSYGDYKSAIPAYLSIPFIKFLGLNELSVRLPTAILAVTAVIACYLLVKNLTGDIYLSLLSAFLFSLSPWAFHFSRFSHEGTIAFVFLLWGFVFWFAKKRSVLNSLLSALFFALSLYSYHNVRVFLPLFILSFFLIKGGAYFKKNKGSILFFFLAFIIFLVPLFFQFKKGNLSPRVKEVSIFHSQEGEKKIMEGLFRYTYLEAPFKRLFNNKIVFFSDTFVRKYLEHFSLEFLFLGKEINPRLGVDDFGKLYLIGLPFLIFGFLRLIFSKKRKFFLILVSWLLLAPLASSLTVDSPHSLRSLIILPVFQIMTAYGFIEAYKQIKKKKGSIIANFFSLTALLLLIINFAYYLHYYYFFYPEYSAFHWQDGYKEMITYVWPIREKYDRIVVSKYVGQPHMFFAFWGEKDPVDYQNQRFSQFDFNVLNATMGKLDNIVFKDIEREEDICLKNTLIVSKPEQFKGLIKPTKIIHFTNRYGKFDKDNRIFDISETERYATLSAEFKKNDVCKKK